MKPDALPDRLLAQAPRALWGLFAFLAILYAVQWWRLPAIPQATRDADSAPIDWGRPSLPEADTWQVFRGRGGDAGESAAGRLASRYRLAGTFFLTGLDWDEEGIRKAVLDDLERQRQFMVAQGESFDDVLVVRVEHDRVTLLHEGREEDLWLSFSGGVGSVAGAPGDRPDRELRWDERVIESNLWGDRIGDNRWILKRDQLLRYYEDVMNDPERLANLFLSMRPVVIEGDEGREITGYVLRPRGEREFYEGVGMREGDVVRNVNSMRMVRQERAEYFIREFVEGRLDAVVMDVDRDGEEQQLIYYIR